ncbi:MAG: hypothetical protein ABEH66_03110 [Halobacteriales archaeon]
MAASQSSSSGLLDRIVSAIMGSASLKLAVVSIVGVFLGATVLDGVWAGMFGVLGATFLLISLSLYGYIWYTKQTYQEDVDTLEDVDVPEDVAPPEE